MKRIFQKLLVVITVIAAASAVFNFTTPQHASAAGNASCRYVLGMVSWDCNTGFTDCKKDSSGEITCKDVDIDEDTIKSGIWAIVANIVTDITVAAAYLVLGFVIYGGYRYIFSGGDPGKVAAGKKTLTQAFIGLAIVMGAGIIMTTLRTIIGANYNKKCALSDTCYSMEDAGGVISSSLTWFIGIAGVAAAVFLIYGGISYMTSAGNPGKVQQAENIIMYALIGLAIVGLAEVIVTIVGSTLSKSIGQVNNETIISKEVHEINSC